MTEEPKEPTSEQPSPLNKKLWASVAVAALVGIGTIGAFAYQGQSTDKEPSSIAQPKEKNGTSQRKKESGRVVRKNKKKKTTDELVEETYDQFGIRPNGSTKNERLLSATLSASELRTVADVIKQQQIQAATETKPVFLDQLDTADVPGHSLELGNKPNDVKPEIPPKPVDPEQPVNPPVEPPVLESVPTIHYQKDIVVVKGSAFNPYAYFQVSDSLDASVLVSVDTTGFTTSVVGEQSFLVVATNKFGHTAVEKVPVYVAAQPEFRQESSVVELPIGSHFDALSYVQAIDETDGDISGQIQVDEAGLNMNREGVYSVGYTVENRFGISARTTLQVSVRNEAPTLIARDIVHEVNQPFHALEGVSARSYTGEAIRITPSDIVASTVDPTKEGVYYTDFQVKDRFGKESAIVRRTVTVENEAPVLLGVRDLTFPIGTELTEELLLRGVTATDREDDKQNLPLVVTLDQEQFQALSSETAGEYPLTYRVVDSMGKETKQEIRVTIVGGKPLLQGIEDKEVPLNQTFDPLEGVCATDSMGNSIDASEIEVSGTVDTSTAGVYSLVYKVKDNNGQYSEDYGRQITVVAPEVVGIPFELPETPDKNLEVPKEPMVVPDSSEKTEELDQEAPVVEDVPLDLPVELPGEPIQESQPEGVPVPETTSPEVEVIEPVLILEEVHANETN